MEDNKYITLINTIIKDVSSIKPIGHHQLKRHYVFLVETDSIKLVVKFYGKLNKWNREVSSLKILEDQLNVPKIVDYGVIDNVEYTITKFIDSEEFEKGEYSNKELQDILIDSGRMLATIHKNNIFSHFGILNSDKTYKSSFDDYKRFYMSEVKRHLDNLDRFSHPEEELIYSSKELLLKKLPSLVSVEKPTLVHNDFSPRNFLIKDGKLVSLIDYEQSFISDKYRELVLTKFQLDLRDKRYYSWFLKGYKEIETFNQLKFDENRLIYLLHHGLAICSWSLEVDKRHYQEGLDLIKKTLKEIKNG